LESEKSSIGYWEGVRSLIMGEESYRIERDSMGEVRVPSWAYWGAQTQRAIENFPVSGTRLPKPFIHILGLVKECAAEANKELGLISGELADAIITAAHEVYMGKWDDHFPLDVFQTGSGTSTNMNANEVISNRANELLGSDLGSKKPVHPNDHVNLGQSSNDVIPTTMHVSIRLEAERLIREMNTLYESLQKKANEFKDVIKIGRTHLQDAVPMTLGQEFSGYATQVKHGIRRVENTFYFLEELAIGGTAIGTGLNAHPDFPELVVKKISERTGIGFRCSENRFEALGSRDAVVEFMGALNTVAVSLMKIANDLRLLSSGPRTGIGEISLPPLQPGSSIMPGKVNPVILEMVIQVAAQVMGANVAVTIGGQYGPLELNMMMPMIAFNALYSIEILKNSVKLLRERCIEGIKANEEQCERNVERSLALVTPLALKIGYDRASEVAYKAYKEGKTIREVVLEMGLLDEEELDKVLDPRRMAYPHDK